MVGVDINPAKIKALQEGQMPFYEPGLDDLLQRNRKRLHFTQNLAEAVDRAQVIFIAVGTPELPDGSADMEPTYWALRGICEAARESKVIVSKSTVPIGASRKVEAFCRENSRFTMDIVNNPEFLRQGAALEDFLKPDRVVIGCASERAKNLMRELYEPFVNKSGKPIIFMDNTSAEMTKYAANSFSGSENFVYQRIGPARRPFGRRHRQRAGRLHFRLAHQSGVFQSRHRLRRLVFSERRASARAFCQAIRSRPQTLARCR